ncbi:hypothetical protein Lalb_Chr19g0125531 [Lupinus albus]|uniref:Uncharacterized protein n=1 Tax=Lupinus albus TaxID=3870 RepID=A0A6A4P0E5_LUPAL|nr:hypothetical protein Lalb_Chr19g0125531 [Lupinus albus]
MQDKAVWGYSSLDPTFMLWPCGYTPSTNLFYCIFYYWNAKYDWRKAPQV